MDHEIYFHVVVCEAIDACAQNQSSLWHAYAACTLTYHLHEHIAASFGVSATAILNEIKAEFPEMHELQAIATASKHGKSSNKNHKYIGLTLSDIYVGKSAAFSDGTYFSDGSSYAEHPPSVVVATPDGSFKEVNGILASAKIKLSSYLAQKNTELLKR